MGISLQGKFGHFKHKRNSQIATLGILKGKKKMQLLFLLLSALTF